MFQSEISKSSNRQFYGLLGTGLLVYFTLSILAGIPAAANMSAFVLGLIVVFLILLGLFAFSWYLLFKPLPANFKIETTSPLSKPLRQGIAVFMVVNGLLGTIGGLWDVSWHTFYGLPFGPDFFWRPHQFIYVALFSPIILAALIWIQTMRHGKGTLQQRFRADIPLSTLMLGGIFMLAILPMDPVWHQIYAEDISGLSVPHTLFSLGNTMLFTGFLSILLSYTPMRQTWEGIWKARLVDVLIAFIGAITIVTLLIVAAGDWEMVSANVETLPNLPNLVAARPEWALIATLSFAAVWVCAITQYSTRLYGIATLSLIIGFVVRQSLFVVFNNAFDGKGTWLILLPFFLSLDLMAWFRAKRGKEIPLWLQALLLTAFGTVISLPLINVFYSNPTVTLSNAPSMVLAMFIATLVALWMGQFLGTFIGNVQRQAESDSKLVLLPSVLRTGLIVLLVLLCFAIWFVSSSTPPVL